MTKTKITTDKAPGAIGPYSQAIRASDVKDFLYCSGQIPLNPESGQLEPAEIRAQTKRVLSNIKNLLAADGYKPDQVLKSTVFLTDMANFQAFNEEYEAFFKEYGDKYPARSTFAVVALPRNALVEIEVVAAR